MPRYRIRLLYDVHGWAYYHRCRGIAKYHPEDFEVTCGGRYGAEFRSKPYHGTLQLCYDCARKIKQHIDNAKYKMVLVTGINVGWGAGKPYMNTALEVSDHVLLNSKLAYDLADKHPKLSYISNGVDLEIFHPSNPITKREPRVLWCGSKFHMKQKGYHDILKPLEDRLTRRGITFDWYLCNSHAGHRLRSQEDMAKWYNTGTVYLCASRTEGTPNPALEAAASGNVLVTTRVGNMPELVDGTNGKIVDRDVDKIEEAIVECTDRYAEMSQNMQQAIQPWHWKVRGQQYYDLFRRLIDAKYS